MRQDGLVHAKSLGQVIRGNVGRSAEFRDAREVHEFHHHVHHEVVVTSAGGAQRVFGQEGREGHHWGGDADSTASTHSVTTASAGGGHAPTGMHLHDTAPVTVGTGAAVGSAGIQTHDVKFSGGRH